MSNEHRVVWEARQILRPFSRITVFSFRRIYSSYSENDDVDIMPKPDWYSFTSQVAGVNVRATPALSSQLQKVTHICRPVALILCTFSFANFLGSGEVLEVGPQQCNVTTFRNFRTINDKDLNIIWILDNSWSILWVRATKLRTSRLQTIWSQLCSKKM